MKRIGIPLLHIALLLGNPARNAVALHYRVNDMGYDRRADGIQFARQHLLLRNRDVCRRRRDDWAGL